MRETGFKGTTLGASIMMLLLPALLTVSAPAAAAGEAQIAANTGVAVTGVRIGRHRGMTRIVLDATGPVNFDYQISKSGKTLVVRLPRVVWQARDYIRPPRGGIVYRIGFFANRESEGGVLSILARRRIGLSRVVVLPPSKQSGHRVVLDIPHDAARGRLPRGGKVRGGKLSRSRALLPPRIRSGRKRASQRWVSQRWAALRRAVQRRVSRMEQRRRQAPSAGIEVVGRPPTTTPN